MKGLSARRNDVDVPSGQEPVQWLSSHSLRTRMPSYRAQMPVSSPFSFVVSHSKQPTLEVRLYGPGETIPANKGDIGFINSGRDAVKVFDTARHLHELNVDQAKTSAGSQFAYS